MLRTFLILLVSVFIFSSCGDDQQAKDIGPKNPKIDKLKIRDGFQVDHLYSPSENDQGSWVAMTFDHKDRLITSDQYGALYRLEIAPIGAEDNSPKLEKLKIQTGEELADSVIQMGYAQGLLYAHNSLYVMVNHRGNEEFEKTSGLYRLQDTDNDDQYDKITLLKELDGWGEHGPHSIVLGPDGASLYVIAGNHTDLPEMDFYQLPNVWKDDNLFPKIKDPRGHANNIGAPGGWIAKIDPEGKNWELVSAGYRNPFDMAFNELGDLFVYDSDMEWDMGMPWYRPTRICHAAGGSEFGWRTGNGKWSPSYPDNSPPIINIGQGSPTNVCHGMNSNFPDKYQRSIFAFDWSFGIIYSIELKPSGATYEGDKEDFLSGIPLPLTDGVFGPDGAMYFMTGGRKLDSDVYRVYYTGEASDNSASTITLKETEENRIRKQLEEFHSKPNKDAINFAWPYLNHSDRFIRYAARLAIEHQPVNTWRARVLKENDPISLINGSLALSRQGSKSDRSAILKALSTINQDQLSPNQKVDLVRTLEVCLSRLGKPNSLESKMLIEYLSPYFPGDSDALNQLLSKTLVYLGDPSIIEKSVILIESQQSEGTASANKSTYDSDLILRNPQYGMAIARTLKDLPPPQHTYYVNVLSAATKGWTPDLRERYFAWFKDAFSKKAGMSYIGFIDKSRKAALANLPKEKFEYYDELSGGKLINKTGRDLENVVAPKGPRKEWKEEDIDSILLGGLGKRDFKQGKNMFLAVGCVYCHVMGGDGGNSGPALTQLGTRFSLENMLEAVISPSAVISDQYISMVFSLKNGSSLVGKLVDEDGDSYNIMQNPFIPDIIRSIPKEEVVDKKFSILSPMPVGTINSMNKEEVKDLLAFLASGGNADHEIYTDKKEN